MLEARDRVGGRVWSERVEGPAGSAVIERGAEFVLDGYGELRRLAARHGLALVDTGMSYYVREPRGVAVDTAALQAAGRRVAGAATTADAGSVAARRGARPAGARRCGARPGRDLVRPGQRAPDTSVLDHVAAFEPLPSHRIAGGNQGLAQAMAGSSASACRSAAGPRGRARSVRTATATLPPTTSS